MCCHKHVLPTNENRDACGQLLAFTARLVVQLRADSVAVSLQARCPPVQLRGCPGLAPNPQLTPGRRRGARCSSVLIPALPLSEALASHWDAPKDTFQRATQTEQRSLFYRLRHRACLRAVSSRA